MKEDKETANTPFTATGDQSVSNADVPALSPMGAVLLVADIEQASRFYQALGFQQESALPNSSGQLTIAFLHFGSSTLRLGRLDELHYENKVRGKQILKGPHGLGVVLTLLIPDLAKVYNAVKEVGLEILLEPVDEFYGDRVFMFLDPDGYEWKISQTIMQVNPEEVAKIVAKS
jgi:uncharacterized glyoxalase superfamily protein PhnB